MMHILAQEDGGMALQLVFSVIGIAIGAVVGYLIGKPRGRGPLGAVLGGILGCLGWIIVAVLPRADNS